MPNFESGDDIMPINHYDNFNNIQDFQVVYTVIFTDNDFENKFIFETYRERNDAFDRARELIKAAPSYEPYNAIIMDNGNCQYFFKAGPAHDGPGSSCIVYMSALQYKDKLDKLKNFSEFFSEEEKNKKEVKKVIQNHIKDDPMDSSFPAGFDCYGETMTIERLLKEPWNWDYANSNNKKIAFGKAWVNKHQNDFISPPGGGNRDLWKQDALYELNNKTEKGYQLVEEIEAWLYNLAMKQSGKLSEAQNLEATKYTDFDDSDNDLYWDNSHG